MTFRDPLPQTAEPVRRGKEPPPGMVEKRGMGIWLTHLGLIVGILFIFFPIWLAFVASTVTQPEIARPPMPRSTQRRSSRG